MKFFKYFFWVLYFLFLLLFFQQQTAQATWCVYHWPWGIIWSEDSEKLLYYSYEVDPNIGEIEIPSNLEDFSYPCILYIENNSFVSIPEKGQIHRDPESGRLFVLTPTGLKTAPSPKGPWTRVGGPEGVMEYYPQNGTLSYHGIFDYYFFLHSFDSKTGTQKFFVMTQSFYYYFGRKSESKFFLFNENTNKFLYANPQTGETSLHPVFGDKKFQKISGFSSCFKEPRRFFITEDKAYSLKLIDESIPAQILESPDDWKKIKRIFAIRNFSSKFFNKTLNPNFKPGNWVWGEGEEGDIWVPLPLENPNLFQNHQAIIGETTEGIVLYVVGDPKPHFILKGHPTLYYGGPTEFQYKRDSFIPLPIPQKILSLPKIPTEPIPQDPSFSEKYPPICPEEDIIALFWGKDKLPEKPKSSESVFEWQQGDCERISLPGGLTLEKENSTIFLKNKQGERNLFSNKPLWFGNKLKDAKISPNGKFLALVFGPEFTSMGEIRVIRLEDGEEIANVPMIDKCSHYYGTSQYFEEKTSGREK